MGLLGQPVEETDNFTHLFYAFGVGLCDKSIQLTGLDSDLEDIVSLGVAATNQTELISQGLLIEEWHFGEAVKQTDYFTHLFHAFGVGFCEQSINQTGFDRDL